MQTLICPTCGCSLVRLGVSKDKAATHRYNNHEYRFCCQGCVDLFTIDPQKYLQKISDVIVCPSCLAEKPLERAVTVKMAERDVQFCGCPYCAELFQKNPDFYMRRLEGTIPHEGVLDHEGRCVRPG